jgi:hypothetical protein
MSIFAGIATSVLTFLYFRQKTSCTPLFDGSDVIVGDRCLTPLWNGIVVRTTGSGIYGGPLLIAAVAGLLVALLLWAVWARTEEGHTVVVKTLISILGGIVTHILLFTYLDGRTTCAVTVGAEDIDPQVGRCVMRIWDGFKVTYPGTQAALSSPGGSVSESWRQLLTPPFLIPGVAGLLVGVILWAAWARRQGQSQNV